MKEINDSTPYNAADIARYLNGEMSPEEMFAVERAALEDPFLADAIEGYHNAMTNNQAAGEQQHLEELTERLKERISAPERKVVPLSRNYWLRIAAGIMILAGTAGLTYVLMNAEEKQQVAKNESLPSVTTDSMSLQERDTNKTAGSAPEALLSTSAAEANDRTIVATDSVSTKNNAQYKTMLPTVENINKESQHSVAVVPQQDKDAVAENQLAGKTSGVEVSPRAMSAPAAAKKEMSMRQEKADMTPFNGNRFSGVVVDAKNNPINGANVIIDNKNVAVNTDKLGNFNVMLPDTSIKVTVEYEGLASANVTLRNNLTDNRIVLTPTRSFLSNEVVVVGYGTEKRRDNPIRIPETNAIPTVGWAAYTDYIRFNKKVLATDSSVHGVVAISFYINKKGKPTDLKVERSLSKSLDAEVKRLLLEGPTWKPLHGKSRSTLHVVF